MKAELSYTELEGLARALAPLLRAKVRVPLAEPPKPPAQTEQTAQPVQQQGPITLGQAIAQALAYYEKAKYRSRYLWSLRGYWNLFARGRESAQPGLAPGSCTSLSMFWD